MLPCSHVDSDWIRIVLLLGEGIMAADVGFVLPFECQRNTAADSYLTVLLIMFLNWKVCFSFCHWKYVYLFVNL